MKDFLSVLLVKRDKLGGPEFGAVDLDALGNGEAQREDTTGGCSRDQVEHLCGSVAGAALDLGENHCGDDTADTAAVDG